MKKVIFLFGLLTMMLFSVRGFAQTTYTKITSISGLEVGANYLIVGHHDDVGVCAMGYQKTNNRHGVVVSESGNFITVIPGTDPSSETDVFQFTLGGSANAWTFFDEVKGGYLYAASSSVNNLRTQTTLDANGRWSIVFNEDGTAEVVAQGENARNHMRFNPNTSNGNPLFSCYVEVSSVDTRVSFYKAESAVQSYSITATVNPAEGGTFRFEDHENLTNKPSLFDFVRINDSSTLADGDMVVFASRYTNENPRYYCALMNSFQDNYSGHLNSTTFARLFVDGKELLPITDNLENYIWNIRVSDGYYTFTRPNGDVLGLGSASSSSFQFNSSDTTWMIDTGTSSSSGWIPNYTGFLITNANNDRAFAFYKQNYSFPNCHAASLSYMTGSYASNYNFYLDIFQGQEKDLTNYNGACRYGATLTVTATPNTGYTFVNWTKDGNEVSTNPTYSFSVTEAGNYVAHFEPNTNVITVSANPDSYGTVSGGGTYLTGSTCTLTATANLGYAFTGWMKEDVEVSTNPQYSFTVAEDGDYVGQFSTPSDLLYTINSDSISVTVTGHAQGTNATGRLVIPESVIINAFVYTVTRIGNNAFKDCESLTGSLIIPSTVTYIGNNAFQNCTGFTGSLTIGEAVTYMGKAAFKNCSNLTIVNYNAIDCEMHYDLPYGTNHWLENCTSLTTLNIGNSVQAIPDRAFQSVRGVSGVYHHNFSGTLVIPNSVTSIGEYAFSYCDGFCGELLIPSSVTSIGKYAFYGCAFCGDLVIPNSVTTINESVFHDCFGFNGDLVIPNSVTTIEAGAFYECTNFSGELIIPNSVTLIGNGAFSRCSGFTGDLIIPNSVITIGESAFYGCKGFTGNLTIGNAVTTVGNDAFEECRNFAGILTIGESVTSFGYRIFYYAGHFSAVYALPMTPPSFGYYTFYSCLSSGAPLYVPCGALEAYQNSSWGSSFSNIQENCTDPVEITATANPAEGGTVEGAGFYYEGYSCTLTATANPGYVFSDWTKDGEVVSTDTVYVFTVTEDASFVANFVESCEITVTANPEEGGTVSGSGVYALGAFVTLTATPNEGYTFVSWTKDGETVTEDETYSFTVTGTAEYVANFVVSGYVTITATANPEEYGIVSGGGIYYTGTICTLTATANEGYNFESWTRDGVVVSTNPIYSFKVSEEGEYVANFNSGITQVSDLAQGWNWWSTCIEQEGIDGLLMLEGSLGSNGYQIKSQTDFVTNYGTMWMGMLSSITNEEMYMLNNTADCQIEMSGIPAAPADHPITVSSGWNWIGYPCTNTMSVAEAFAGYTPSDGDQVKSQSDYSMYYSGMWIGQLQNIVPGTGLMYKSNSTTTTTLVYPDGGRSTEMTTSPRATHWTNDIHAYPNNMTVMAVVELDGQELDSDSYELAAFDASGECRGSVRLMYVEPIDRYMAFLTVSGKDAAVLSFRLYDTETGTEYYDANENLNFATNAVVGDADDLYTIHFRGMTGMDELASSVKVYPNPVNRGEQFSIGMTDNGMKAVRVEMVNAIGVETLRATSVQMPATLTAPATAGVYTVRITVEGKGTIVRKLIVK